MKNDIEKQVDRTFNFVRKYMAFLVLIQLGLLGFGCYIIYKIVQHFGIV